MRTWPGVRVVRASLRPVSVLVSTIDTGGGGLLVLLAQAREHLKRLPAQAMKLRRERTLSGALRLLQRLGHDAQCLIRVSHDDQSFGQVGPMREPHSLADRAKEIGAFARPDDIRFTDSLPKTRSGKIMRRLLRDIAAGKETTGDTTTLEDYSVLARLREEDE